MVRLRSPQVARLPSTSLGTGRSPQVVRPEPPQVVRPDSPQASEIEHGAWAYGRVMSVPLCLCGTPLVTDVEMGLWLCGHCGRAFCRDCGGTMARVGGCDTCTVCGMGMCG
jgi:hypothetical protein